MIIDIIGLPGSGKTFFSNSLVEYFKREGIKVINMTENRRASNFFKKLTIYIDRKLAFLSIDYQKLQKSLDNILKDVIVENKDLSTFKKYKKELSYSLYVHKKYAKETGIFIFDEGCYHELCALLMRFGFDNREYEVKLHDILKCLNIKNIYFRCSTDIAFQSIRKRNRHTCEFDELGDEELRKYLTELETLISSLKVDFDLRIDRNLEYNSEFENMKSIMMG